MIKSIIKSSLIHLGVMFSIIVLFIATTVFAINKETEFVPDATYDFLFYEGLSIVRSNIVGKVIMGTNGYTSQPRLKRTSRPRRVEYTTFSFDGYWERRPWNRRFPQSRFWDKRHKRDEEKDKIPGKWYFKVRWTTKTKKEMHHGLLTVVEFEEVVPKVYFIRYGPTQERHDFIMEKRFPDKDHKTRAYANGRFGIYREMK